MGPGNDTLNHVLLLIDGAMGSSYRSKYPYILIPKVPNKTILAYSYVMALPKQEI